MDLCPNVVIFLIADNMHLIANGARLIKRNISAKSSLAWHTFSFTAMTIETLKVNSKELVETIHSTAEAFGAKGVWGPAQTQTGVCRLALSDLDKQVKDWFIAETTSIGCTIKVDECGNIFATYPGLNNDAKPTGIGSHLDTQPTGGRYDGIYGVLAGLQVLRTLHANNIIPKYPITLVDWCNEEGARFPMSLMSSSVWAGIKTKEDIYALKDVYDNETTVEHELKRIGYMGDVKCSHLVNQLDSHFEIHIEQGPILEKQGKTIGVVTGAQAYNWLSVTFHGMAQHTGTTPMEYRRDAMLAMAKIAVGINDIAKKHGGLATIAKMDFTPNVVNVIVEKIDFVIDIRHETDKGYKSIEDDVYELIELVSLNKAGNGTKLNYEINAPYPFPATHFDTSLVEIINDAANAVVGSNMTQRIVSGAGHDSCATNLVIPTAMIFVPSVDGVSHNPCEHTDPDQLEAGFKVLLETILRYDSRRTM